MAVLVEVLSFSVIPVECWDGFL